MLINQCDDAFFCRFVFFIIISLQFFFYSQTERVQSVVATHRITSKVVAKSNKLQTTERKNYISLKIAFQLTRKPRKIEKSRMKHAKCLLADDEEEEKKHGNGLLSYTFNQLFDC